LFFRNVWNQPPSPIARRPRPGPQTKPADRKPCVITGCIAVCSAVLLTRALPSIPLFALWPGPTSRTSWTLSTSWTLWPSRTRREPGRGASRQHPLKREGADRPGSTGVCIALLFARALPSIPLFALWLGTTSRTSWTLSTSWTLWTSRTRRGPGRGASRQHPLKRGGADRPGSAGLSSRRSGEPPMARPWRARACIKACRCPQRGQNRSRLQGGTLAQKRPLKTKQALKWQFLSSV
jgi:hypothetical protein